MVPTCKAIEKRLHLHDAQHKYALVSGISRSLASRQLLASASFNQKEVLQALQQIDQTRCGALFQPVIYSTVQPCRGQGPFVQEPTPTAFGRSLRGSPCQPRSAKSFESRLKLFLARNEAFRNGSWMLMFIHIRFKGFLWYD